eukprot:TRINITY_DN18876_c0_g1_i1.p1 TRINITY_DN18876_c0_g1~~TRINITY_DN18876_c0_g1_i1.p1  ORF type:complete len:140 (+),score=10.55 TRINITY_DN18876_c0_g1_i1:30-449(+)
MNDNGDYKDEEPLFISSKSIRRRKYAWMEESTLSRAPSTLKWRSLSKIRPSRYTLSPVSYLSSANPRKYTRHFNAFLKIKRAAFATLNNSKVHSPSLYRSVHKKADLVFIARMLCLCRVLMQKEVAKVYLARSCRRCEI